MCTVLLRFAPGTDWPVLLAAVRDEFTERPWDPPAEHWPGLLGGRDRVAGGTWLAVDPAMPAVSALLNGWPRLPEAIRPSRGELPLGPTPDDAAARRYDAFHLVRATPAAVDVLTWDGATVTRQRLAPGDHVIVNQGVDVNDLAALHKAATPDPRPGLSTEQAWGDWVPLLSGGEFTGVQERPLIMRTEILGKPYGSGSASLVALGEARLRYDFTANPGPAATWSAVLGG